MLLKSMESACSEDIVEDLMIRSFSKRKDMISTIPANKRVEKTLQKYPPMMKAKQVSCHAIAVILNCYNEINLL